MNRPSESIEAEAPARFSVEEFMAVAEILGGFPGKVELVDGVVVRMSPAHHPHFTIQRQLFRRLDAIFGDGIDGFIVGQELTIRLHRATVRCPDVAIFRDPGIIKGIPDGDVLMLAAEVSDSSLPEDIGPKRLDYAAAGVPEYWVVDINARLIHRFTRPADGDYVDDEEIAFGEPIAVRGTDQTITLG